MKSISIKILCLCGFLSSSVIAADHDGAIVTELMQDSRYQNFLFIDLDVRQSSLLGCHDNARWEYVLDMSDENGKSMLSLLLAARMSGEKVNFRDLGVCAIGNSIPLLGRIEV